MRSYHTMTAYLFTTIYTTSNTRCSGSLDLRCLFLRTSNPRTYISGVHVIPLHMRYYITTCIPPALVPAPLDVLHVLYILHHVYAACTDTTTYLSYVGSGSWVRGNTSRGSILLVVFLLSLLSSYESL